MSRRGIAAVAVVGVALATPALAEPRSQNYPERAVTIVVAVAPGGGIDTLARAFADKLRERLGQAVVVENRAGAAGSSAPTMWRNRPPMATRSCLPAPPRR